jgi:putative membrane protein
MILDTALAYAHYLAAFALIAILAGETLLLRPGLTAADVARLSRLDLFYGLVAVAVLALGLARAVYGVKGWEFYAGNPYFWAKLSAFIVMGLLSVPPTLRFPKWKRAAAATGALPDVATIRSTRVYVIAQWTVFLAIPLLAAALGRNLSY